MEGSVGADADGGDGDDDLVSDVRPLDVLLGRGNFHHPGNGRFLRIVASRRDEYVAAPGHGAKAGIAREVIEGVYDPHYMCHLSGDGEGFDLDGDGGGGEAAAPLRPGRFLQLEPRSGGDDDDDDDDDASSQQQQQQLYRIISGKTVEDKVKMNLRQKPRGGKDAASRGGLGPANERRNNKSNSGRGKRRVAAAAPSKSAGNTTCAANTSCTSRDLEEESFLAERLDDELFLDDDENGFVGLETHQQLNNGIVNVRDGAGACSSSSRNGALPGTVQPEARQRLLNNVSVAHLQASNLAAEHRAAESAGRLDRNTAVPQSLETLGRALFEFFTGVDPSPLLLQRDGDSPSPAAAAEASLTADCSGSGDCSAPQRRRKRTGMVGGGSGREADGTSMPSLSSSTISPGLGLGAMALSDRLRDAGLPVSLCTVITSLLDAADPAAPDRYMSSAEVKDDLGLIVSEPDRYLFGPQMDPHVGTLHFKPNRLYGREKQCEQIESAFDKIIVTQEETHGYLLISGPPGSGKTALVEKLRDSLAERRGMFVWIKFDSQQQEDPMVNICRGLDEYFQRLLRGDPSLLSDIGSAVKEALGSNMAVMKDLIPALELVAGGWPESHHETEGRETYNLILHCLKKVVNAIAHPSHPVIVLFDDLQWSDAASQDIIRMLVTDEASVAAMFIGCYRDNEVDERHPVAENVGAILMSLVPLATVRLENLDKESVNDLCSDVLHLSPRITRPLAAALHSKTNGNPMFVRQLMRSLYEDGLLQYAASERRWSWDINAIRTKAVADNAVDLLIAMMASYGPEVRRLLQVASCLGFRFDVAALTLLVSASDDLGASGSEISSHIDTVMADGLLLTDGANAYRFSHDQIWLAAYSLTPLTARSELHLLVGRQLRKQAIKGGHVNEYYLFTATDQLNRGIGAVTNHAEELEIAELNLRAGESALSAFLFQPASTYLLQGSALLNEDDWNTDYNLCIQLYSACAEVLLAQGRNDGAIEYVSPVLANARSADERVRAREVQILTNIAQTKYQDAVHNSMLVLQELGVDFSNTDPTAMKDELVKTQSLLEASSSDGQSLLENILAKPVCNDARQIGLMRILSCASRAAYVAQPKLMIFIVLRMVQLTLVNEEITAESPYAFAALSFAMCGLGNHNLSYLASKVASALNDRFDKKYACRVNVLINIGSLGYFQPMQAIIESLRQCLKDAVSVGSRDWARISFVQLSPVAIGAPERGKSLDDVEKEMSQVLAEFSTQEDGLMNNLVMAILYLQMLLNLKEENSVGDAAVVDPTVLTGAVMNQEEYLRRCEEEGLTGDYIRRFYCCRLYLAYLFHQHSLAEDMVKGCEEVAQLAKFCPFFEIVTETFYMGLIAAEALQQRMGVESASDIERWQQLATNSLNTLTKWAEEGSEWNFLHKAALLRAEIAVSTGDTDTAVSSFQSAIMGARNSCYINEEALSCERAGMFHASQGDIEEARAYLRRAESLYNLWGARRKALDVSQLIVDHCT